MSHYSTEAMVWVARLRSTATQMPLSSKSKHKDRGIPLCLCTGRCVYRVRRLGGPTERGRLGGGILFALLNLSSYFHCLSSQPQPSLGYSSHHTAPDCSSSSLLPYKATLGSCLETFYVFGHRPWQRLLTKWMRTAWLSSRCHPGLWAVVL